MPTPPFPSLFPTSPITIGTVRDGGERAGERTKQRPVDKIDEQEGKEDGKNDQIIRTRVEVMFLLWWRAAQIEVAEGQLDAFARTGDESEKTLAHVAFVILQRRRREGSVALAAVPGAHERPIAF